MMPKWIDNASNSPSVMLVFHRPDNLRSCSHSSRKNGVRVGGDQHHPYGSPAQRLGTKIQILRRFAGNPKPVSTDRKFRNDVVLITVEARKHVCAKSRFVKFH